ncbi:MAG TPA: histidine kinase [Allosphingosinicella sp.]|nr:histidine kinase [Allosphingosinicella sp.]
MASLSLPRPEGRFHDLPLAIKSIVGFWSFYFLTVLARSPFMEVPVRDFLLLRSVSAVVGALLTFLVYVMLRLLAARGSLRRMAIIAALASIPAAATFSVFSFTMFRLNDPLATAKKTEEGKDGTTLTRTPDGQIILQRPNGQAQVVLQAQTNREMMMKYAPRMLVDGTVTWYFFFAAWSAIYVALSSAAQLRQAERRASEFERAAQSAHLRALRYQVNPHFLFNTLNSLSSLIMARRDEEAERMIMNLSNFFRATLATDPTADVSLSEEIALQRLYLDIEKARFPNRLQVEVDIPERLQSARVPALLLQPVVENAIKYGVARAKDIVTLTIRAEQEGARLHLIVENSGDPASAIPALDEEPSTGVGLTNVCQRLQARFGVSTSCDYGPRPEGGFRVALTMPLVTHG